MKILDLGFGDNKVDGSIDIVRLPHVDIAE